MQLRRYPRTSNRRNRYLACSSFILRARTKRSAGVLLIQFLTLVRIQSKKWSWIPIIVTVCPLSVTVSILNGNCLRVNVKHCSLRQYRKCSTRLSGFPTPIFQNYKFHHIHLKRFRSSIACCDWDLKWGNAVAVVVSIFTTTADSLHLYTCRSSRVCRRILEPNSVHCLQRSQKDDRRPVEDAFYT